LDAAATTVTPLPTWVRAALAVIVGAFFVVLLGRQSFGGRYGAADLTPLITGVRTLPANPYTAARPPVSDQLLYPVPALIVAAPFAALPLPTARALWGGLAAAALTLVALSRFGWHGFAVLASRCAERALALAQWSPWFFMGALVPPVQFIAAAKPTVALMAFAYRPTRWAVIGAVLLGSASFVLRPTWLGEWLAVSLGHPSYTPAVLVWRGGGPLLLAAALRWRRPEARLLLAMALVPHHYVWYDQLLLFLVPRQAREVWALSALSWISLWPASAALATLGLPETGGGQVAFRAPIVALLYLPCLAMVLWRPNEGDPR
jgi:hypothetical protein